MRIAIWHHPTREGDKRAYLNGLPGLARNEKAFFRPKGAGVELVTQPKSLYDEVVGLLMDSGMIESEDGLESLSFQEIEALASPAGKSAQKPRPAAPKPPPAPIQGGYDARRVEADALDLATIPVPDPVRIRIDHREPAALFSELEGLDNVEVIRDELPVGDIEINGHIIIERKACTGTGGRTDFETSVIESDKRLFFQSEKLRLQEDCIPIVLLEGQPHVESTSMLVQQIDGMISFLITLQRINVITTFSLHHTAYMVLKLATHDMSGLGYELSLRGKKPSLFSEQLAFMLEGLPNVSGSLARRLGDHFGSLAALTQATPAQLAEVRGMGPKRIHAIWPVLHGEPLPTNRPVNRG